MIDDNNGWSHVVIARVLSSYTTSILDFADLMKERWPESSGALRSIAARIENIAGDIRAQRAR